MTPGEERDGLGGIVAAADAAIGGLGWIPVSTIIVAQIVDQDGDRCTLVAAGDAVTTTEALGLLGYATARQNAKIMREELDGD